MHMIYYVHCYLGPGAQWNITFNFVFIIKRYMFYQLFHIAAIWMYLMFSTKIYFTNFDKNLVSSLIPGALPPPDRDTSKQRRQVWRRGTVRSWRQVKVWSRKCRSMVARNVLGDTTLGVFTNHGSAAHYYLGGCTKWDMTKILSCDWDALWCTVITTTTNTQLKNLSTYTCPSSPV